VSKPLSRKVDYTHEWLRLDQLLPHPEIQRSLVKAHAETIAASFDPDAFGELYVIRSAAGLNLIWDGQHRWYAAKKALGEDQEVYCRVYEDVNAAELAKRSLLLNTQRAWQPIDRYRVRVKAGEWKARTVHGTLHNHGLKVSPSSDEGNVAAVVACDWIIDKAGGPAALDRVIGVLKGAWGKDRDAYHNTLLRGMALICNAYNGAMNDEAMSSSLAKAGGPAKMIGRARDRAKVDATSAPRAAAFVMVQEYNKGKGKNRLPPLPG
jgi:hypothetical protein